MARDSDRLAPTQSGLELRPRIWGLAPPALLPKDIHQHETPIHTAPIQTAMQAGFVDPCAHLRLFPN